MNIMTCVYTWCYVCIYNIYIYIYYVGEMYTPFPWLVWNKAGTLFLAIRNASLGLAGLADGSLSTFRRKYLDPHGCMYIYICIIYIRGSRQCNAVQRNVRMSVSKSRGTLKSSKIWLFKYWNPWVQGIPGENAYPWFDDLWSEKADDYASPFREYFQRARFEWFFQDAALQVKLWNWFEKNPSSVPPFQHWRLWVGGETRTMISLGVHKSHQTFHRWLGLKMSDTPKIFP